jgi:hypothetical protein
LTNITIPNSVSSLGNSVFSDCGALVKATLSSKLKAIPNNLFSGCSLLTNAVIPANVATIGSSAFLDCSRLYKITIPSKVKTIGDNAFFNCSSLASITLPSSVTSLGSSAFANCASLTNATLSAKLITLGDHAFLNCASLGSIAIPKTVLRIGNYSFASCASLTNVVFQTTLIEIGMGAFSGCSELQCISIPSSVTTLGYQSFLGCPKLRYIYFLGKMPASIDATAFQDSPLASVYYPSTATGWTATAGGATASPVSAPLIALSPASQLAQLGTAVQFSVVAYGPGTLSYQWQLNGTKITKATSAIYKISSAQAKNAGDYTIIVRNSYGSATSSPAALFFKPVVAITQPKANTTVSNNVLNVIGTALGNFTAGKVYYRLGSSEWVDAQGTTNWSGSVALSPGASWISAYALDALGNSSPVVSNKVTYVPSSTLAAAVSGSGAISGALSVKTAASQLIAVGKTVTLTATPASGSIFVGWTGWTNSESQTITFAIPSEDLQLTAQFAPSPFLSGAGAYKGLITSDDPFDSANNGFFALNITSGGAYTAQLVSQTQTKISASGKVTLYNKQTNMGLVQFAAVFSGRSVNVQFLISFDTNAVSGTMTAAGTTTPSAQIEGAKTANIAVGQFNISAAPAAIYGCGYGIVGVSNKAVRVNLTLPDDKAFITAFATDRLTNGTIPVFVPLYGGKGFFSGWLVISNQQIVSRSAMAWRKDAGASATSNPSGFDSEIAVQGGIYASLTNLASWGQSELLVDGKPRGTVHFSSSSYSKNTIAIPVADTQYPAATPWSLASRTGAMKLFNGTNAGGGILIPLTAPTPGVFGFVTETNSGLLSTRFIYSVPALP